MNKKVLFLFLSIFPIFLLVYFVHQYLLQVFNITNIELANKFFVFILSAGFVMLTNMLLVQILKPKITGFVFLAWSMLKVILVMMYFALVILPQHIDLPNSVIYDMIIIYSLLLIYETVFSVLLIDRH